MARKNPALVPGFFLAVFAHARGFRGRMPLRVRRVRRTTCALACRAFCYDYWPFSGQRQRSSAMSNSAIARRKTVAVRVGDVTIGGDAPVVVQSMTNTDTADPPFPHFPSRCHGSIAKDCIYMFSRDKVV